MALQKDILGQLQHARPSPREYNFAPIDAMLPVDTLDAFAALEEKIASDEEFKKLLVGNLTVCFYFPLIFMGEVLCYKKTSQV